MNGRRINGSETNKKGMDKGRDGGTEREEWMEEEMQNGSNERMEG